mmetsp:Transcript_636/g.1324  ORF Transcript_636/g.1324 Transcript_636/m.1324 type:complete len:103 (-) Transcript_636:331-639(-)
MYASQLMWCPRPHTTNTRLRQTDTSRQAGRQRDKQTGPPRHTLHFDYEGLATVTFDEGSDGSGLLIFSTARRRMSVCRLMTEINSRSYRAVTQKLAKDRTAS